MRDKKILVIIPAYNEQSTVGSIVEKIHQSLKNADILVVNDGSSDNTSQVAGAKGAIVLDFPYNLGIGAAMQAGYKFAYRKDYDIAVQCDADGQHRPAQINILIDALTNENVDMVLGSRFLRKKRFKSEIFRLLGILIFSRVLSLFIGQRITDPTSGFRAVNKEVIKSFSISYPEDYPEPEALLLLHRQKFTIKEVAVNMNSRKGGNSTITGWRPFYYMVKVLLAIFIDLFKRVPYKKETLIKETESNAQNSNNNRCDKHFNTNNRLRTYQKEKA